MGMGHIPMQRPYNLPPSPYEHVMRPCGATTPNPNFMHMDENQYAKS